MTPRWRLFTKYLALIVALVSLVLLASSGITLYFSYKENQAQLVALQQEKANAAATRIEQYIRNIEEQLGWTALPAAGAGASLPEQRRFEYLKLLRQVPAITEVSWIDDAGREQLKVSRLAMDVVGSNTDYSKEARFTQAKGGRTYFSPVYFRKETEPYLTISRPAGGRGGGVTVAEVNLKFVWEVVSQIKIGKAGLAYVVNAGGILIAHPDISLVLQRTDLNRLPHVAALKGGDRTAALDIETRIGRDLKGREVLTAHAPIPTLDWEVLVEMPLVEALEPIYVSLVRTALLLLLGLVLSVVASVFLARRMVSPIRALQQGAAEIGAGKLDQRIEVHTGDELEALSEQFNKMAAELKASYAGLERKIEERTRELEIANKHKSEFLANMSHELRTPLNAIIGFSEVLGERMFGELNDKQADYVKDIHESGKHLLSLINDILDLSKIEAGRMELDLSEFHLPSALENAITLVRERALTHGIVLKLRLDPRLDKVRADERKFKQIVLNLLSNAVKFTPDGGRVEVDARINGGTAEVAVKDTGVGIAPEDQDTVFEEFRQVGRDYTTKHEGTGLGLALTRRFVELHGGNIRLESALGKGSTFTFTLPLIAVARDA
jgi:signal transduction histidine kinase